MDVCDDYGNPLQISVEDVELLHEDTTSKNNIDWEQRRFDLVKAITQGSLSRPITLRGVRNDIENFSKTVLYIADAVIEKLKESKQLD